MGFCLRASCRNTGNNRNYDNGEVMDKELINKIANIFPSPVHQHICIGELHAKEIITLVTQANKAAVIEAIKSARHESTSMCFIVKANRAINTALDTEAK